VTRIDQEGNPSHHEYDALGRLAAVVDALGNRTSYGYDEAGNLVTLTDANLHTTAYEYDGVGRRIATVRPLGQRSTTVYDPVGNVTSATDFNGDTIAYEYDLLNRVTVKRYPDLTETTFSYTPTGRVETVTDARGTTSFTYDGVDRLLSRTEPDGASLSYTFDGFGNILTLTAPSGTTAYTYDALNRIETVTGPDRGVTTYAYDVAGNLKTTTLPNGAVESRTHDALNRLALVEHRTATTAILASFAYTLDANGDRIGILENGGRQVDYAYDALRRLIGEIIVDPVNGHRTISYTYDAVGNRLTRDDSVDGLTTCTYDDNDRLVAESTGGTPTTYTHDGNGNTLTKFTDASNKAVYSWDFDSRLAQADVTEAGVLTTTTYLYDYTGIRVAETVGGGTETRFLIDVNRNFEEVIEEYEPGGTLLASYVYGNDLISQDRGTTRSYYHVDGLGSTRALTDAAGAVTDTCIFDGSGRVLATTGATVNRYQFAGEARDTSTGLNYHRARYMDPAVGRFLSTDPFDGLTSDPVSLHRYLYAADSPVNRIDPSGELSLITVSFVSMGIGTIQTSLAKGGFKAIKNSFVIAKVIIQPGYSLIEVGFGLSGKGVPGAIDLVTSGRQIISIGFKAIGASILTVYQDVINGVITGPLGGILGIFVGDAIIPAIVDIVPAVKDYVKAFHELVQSEDLAQFFENRDPAVIGNEVDEITETGTNLIRLLQVVT
jgi:RHS repeat-associated protein